MVFMLPIWLTPHVAGLSCGYAVLKGRTEERIVAVSRTFVGVCTLTSYQYLGEHLARGARLHQSDMRDVAIQAIELTIALIVALRSSRRWPLLYAATVLVSFMTSCAEVAAPVSRWAYVTGLFVWDYLADLTLVVGTARSWRTTQLDGRVLRIGVSARRLESRAGR